MIKLWNWNSGTSDFAKVQEIYHLPEISLEELMNHYKIIAEKYSRDTVTGRFIDAFHL